MRGIIGQMQARLVMDSDELHERSNKMGIKDPDTKFEVSDLVRGDCPFAAIGVTTGPVVGGVQACPQIETIVMRWHRNSQVCSR
jgi:fructose-1,6-bisphosphatase II / sedoheptulose-1,7-bisphosphatase